MCWPAWRLWLEGKVQMSELDHLSIDDVDLAGEAFDAWRAAEARASKRKGKA